MPDGESVDNGDFTVIGFQLLIRHHRIEHFVIYVDRAEAQAARLFWPVEVRSCQFDVTGQDPEIGKSKQVFHSVPEFS